MQNKQKILSVMVIAACGSGLSTQSIAALNPDAILSFAPGVTSTYGKVLSGSFFGMDISGDSIVKKAERTAISVNNGLAIGTTQDATGSHSGAADGTESPDIDAAWGFFGNTGMHYAIAPTNILTDDGAGNATLDFSGWGVVWNSIPRIDMSKNAWEGNSTGIAIVTCSAVAPATVATCTPGDTYTLAYSATVPPGDPSGFGNVKYNFFLTGTIPDMPPTAVDDTITVNQDSTANTMGVLGNDTDGSPNGEEGQTITVTAVETATSAAQGTVSLDSLGAITYTPNAGATGIDTFDYTVSDGTNSATANVNVTINAKPVPVDDLSTTTPNSTILFNITGNDIDETPTLLTNITLDTTGTQGVVTDNADGSVTYNAAGIADGTSDTFTYTVTDPDGATSDTSGTVTVLVSSTPPPLCGNGSITTNRNTDGTIDLTTIASVDAPKTLDLSTVSFTGPGSGSIALDAVTGVVTYTPATDSITPDSFTYTLDDSTAVSCSANGTVSITVNNATPTTSNLTAGTTIDNGTNIDVSSSVSDDLASNLLTLSTSTPASGTVTINNLIATYTPSTGFNGTDSFTYSVTDGDGTTSNTSTVTVNVELAATDIGTIPATSTVTPGGISSSISGLSADVVGIDQRMSSQCVGGCIDYVMSNLGSSTTGTIVVQLSQGIPANAIYRKKIAGGWRNFESDSNNFVQSAPLTGSNCPGATSTAYTNGLTVGNQCLKVTIEDNGSNDTDATTGTIADPSGVAVEAPNTGFTNGCSMTGKPGRASEHADWWLLSAFIGLLGWFSLKRKKA